MPTQKRPSDRMSDAAVKAKTGKTWDEWFAILDRAGAVTMTHTEMARYLYEKQHVSGWWSQMVAVTYEQARGLRDKHQRPEGYQVSASKVLNVPIAALYQSWDEAKARDRWLGEKGLMVRKATPNKSIRMTWTDGKTSVDVDFYAKGPDKSQVTVQHSKLPTATKGERMQAYWRAALERLKASL
ncbi:MAG: hypothetical protein HYX97_07070 [Chloroflexi bacterium]|nr:hypothetical protein [Chloroflexota bacterium]